MGFLYLIISALLDGIKGCASKPVSRHTATLTDSLLVNFCRTVLCAIFGFFFCVMVTGRLPNGGNGLIPVTLLSGMSTALFMISWLMAVRTGAFMTLTVLGTASCILPILLSFLFFGEAISPRQLLGSGILVLASWLLCAYQKKTKGHFSVGEILWMALMFLSCALVSFSQKVFIHTVPDGHTADYNFFTYIAASLFIAVFLLYNRFRTHVNVSGGLLKKVGFLVIFLSFSLYFVDYFRTLAAETVPAGILYPTSSGIVLLINQGFSILALKEKPDLPGWLGLILTLAAIILINL